jgi:Protein of unknown function (DUF3108)
MNGIIPKKSKKMKKIVFALMLLSTPFYSQKKEDAFSIGEYFRFRVHYGLMNAGYASLELKDGNYEGKKVFHAVGLGYTTGMAKLFFKVTDNYESFFDKETVKPYRAIRKINEGGYTKNQESFFDHTSNKVLQKDYKNKTEKFYTVSPTIQDIVSTFYYLRNYPNIDKLKKGESVGVDMFLDDETIKFKLKFLGVENISTKFGILSAMIFRPLVLSGRVFKEEESLTVWISNDDNKIPLRVKASLAVGSLKADLEEFKGLKHPFKVK